ncbi:MAG: hypothetical protein ACJAXJ_004284 [Colwellia sp.]|jgi:hypothetical protein
MSSLQILLPGEDILAAPARWHYLTETGAINHSYKRMGLSIDAQGPHRLFNSCTLNILNFIGKGIDDKDVREHSLINLETAYLTLTERKQWIDNRIKPKFTTLASVYPKRWRWCPDCVVEDEAFFGMSYYHRDHQLPGVFHCIKHSLGLAEQCDECGWDVTHIKNQQVPPMNNRCPSCGVWLSSYDGLFTSHMADIEGAILQLVNHEPAIDLLRQDQFKLRSQIGMSPNSQNTMAEQKALSHWRREFLAYYSPSEIKSWFSHFSQSNGVLVPSMMRSPRLTMCESNAPVIHPLVHLLAMHYINSYQTKGEANESASLVSG